MKKINPDFLATALGLAVAVANAWATIDWDNFQFTGTNVMKLTLSGVIALGGYMSTIKTKQP
jgi:hypothetical protein